MENKEEEEEEEGKNSTLISANYMFTRILFLHWKVKSEIINNTG